MSLQASERPSHYRFPFLQVTQFCRRTSGYCPRAFLFGAGGTGEWVSWYACSRPFLQETCAHLGESCIPYDHLENWQRLRRPSMLIPKNPQSYHQGDGPQLHVQRLIKDALESS